MSGDVQPRKRKDKKKKKDDLGAEEARGTASALGEGDVFMHSYHDHGTGGHWCAKIIFFSLLAVLVTLIGLIILENRGLTELEANSVESRYSGVLEGWIEDAVDDHHDEHTLELKHHDDDEDHPDEQLDENDGEEESLEEEIDHDDDDDEESKEENDEIEDDEGSKEENDEIEDDEGSKEENDEIEDDEGSKEENDEIEDDEGSKEENDEIEDDEGSKEENDEIEDDTNNDDDDEDEEDDSRNDEDGDSEEDEIQNDDDIETHNDNEGLDDNSNEDGGEYDEGIEENLKDEDEEEEPYEHYHYEEVRESNNDIDENDDEGDDEDMEELKHDYISKEMTSHYNYQSYEDNGEDESIEHNTEDEASEEDDQDDDDEQEIEKIEKEIDGDDSEEVADDRVPASKEKRESSKEEVKEEASNEDDEPPIEKISRPQAGKPFIEIEEEPQVKPVDTLAEEEAYERQQEELRRQEEEAPHSLWLKLFVGGALLAATHALVRRHTRPDAPETEDAEDETPSLTDRRMTIVEEPIRVAQTSPSQTRQIVDEDVFKRPAPVQSAPIAKPIEEEIVKEVVAKVLDLPKIDAKKEEEKELYSEEEEEDEEEEVEEDNELPLKEPAKKQEAEESEPEPEPEEVSDVEIIYDETVEEEEVVDEEVEEEEISDVDDAELLSRLEAKYGRLPEPERPGQYKGGGNSLEAEWPGEPSDPYWRSQLDAAEEEFRQGAWSLAAARAGGAGLAGSGRARWLRAAALDRAAEHHRDNRLLADAVAAYLHLLDIHEALTDRRLLEAARRAVDRIQFRGTYLRAEPVYRLLIRRFPDVVEYRNNLTVLFLMANRADLADEVLRETLRLWPNDRVALAHHGFVLKTHYNKLEEAVLALRKALDGDAGAANEPRFYYHLGDALLTLGRFDEAHEVHKRGAKLGHFLSPSQRSLYNVPRLRGRPWWRVEDTPYVDLARALEASWRDILKEGEAAVALYEQEKEGLKERGEWSQLDIFVRGREVGGRCERAPAICNALRGAGRGKGEGQVCRRGQVKFSMMTPGTHVRPHVGPTNCRLRMHLALSNTEGTYIRVDKEIRQWQLGKTFIFDDSFEHEVWHNGTGTRLVLIVDVWHPDLTAAERRQLPAI